MSDILLQQIKDDLFNLADVDLLEIQQLITQAENTSREIPTPRGKFITSKLHQSSEKLEVISKWLKNYEPELPETGQAVG